MNAQAAILIVGPTGSGKTPLGEALAAAGLWGRRCVHFDFGARLRAAAEGDNEADLSDEQLAMVRASLKSGALLTDEQFPIAEKILRAFLRCRGYRPARPSQCPQAVRHVIAADEPTPSIVSPDNAEDLLVLNGLPRHAGQAVAIEPIADVRTLAYLDCPPKVAVVRIRTNAGGDRLGRADDDFQSVWKRHEVFASRTAPLVEHYRARGARVELLAVGPITSAEDLRRELENRR